MPNSQARAPEEEDEKPSEKNYDSVIGRKIDGWEVIKVLGQGTNGVCFKVKKDNVVGALKLPFRNVQEMVWESLIYDRLADAKNIESRNGNIVRKYAQGMTSFPEEDLENVAYVVMELANSNVWEHLQGDMKDENPISFIGRVTCMMIRAVYDQHQVGFLNRDIKLKNCGMPEQKGPLLMYDVGMCRRWLDPNGKHRLPRSSVPFRGTDEWSSLRSELAFEQGRVDDLYYVLHLYNELTNICCEIPQAWSKWGNEAGKSPESVCNEARYLLKSDFGPGHLVLDNCHVAAHRVRLYLRTLGTTDDPDYFHIAMLFNETRVNVKKKIKSSPIKMSDFMEECYLMEHYYF